MTCVGHDVGNDCSGCELFKRICIEFVFHHRDLDLNAFKILRIMADNPWKGHFWNGCSRH